MGRGKELTVDTRSRICELKSIGWSYREIQNRFPQIPLSTIKSTVLREHKRVQNASNPRSGPPKKLSEEDEERIKSHIQQDPHVTYDDLLADVDYKVKRRSIQRFLHTNKLRK
jgi:transposase